MDRVAGAWESTPVRWKRCAFVAVSLHLTIVTFLFSRYISTDRSLVEPSVEPLVRGMLVDAEPIRTQHASGGRIHSGSPDSPTADSAIQADVTTYEPDAGLVGTLAGDILTGMRQTLGPDALDKLADKSRTLERISSPEEVSRMAAAIARTFGARTATQSPTTAPADGRFDFDAALLTNVSRTEVGGVTRITQHLSDSAGRTAQVVTSRHTDAATGDARYELCLVEPGRRSAPFRVGVEEFAEAEASYRPFAVLERFPLVQQLHREAVVPILGKLIEDDSSLLPADLRRSRAAPSTSPP